MVTPVANAPIALRNSTGFRVMTVETLLARSLSPSCVGRDVASYVSTVYAAATAYITTARRCIIRCNVAVTSIRPAGEENLVATLADLCPGEPISREVALRLICCPD